MEWSEIVLTLGLSAMFGLPLLGFGLYWTAEFLGLRVRERTRRLSASEAESLRAQIAALQAQVDQLRGGEARLDQLEEQIAFMERLLDERSPATTLPPAEFERPGS